MMSEQTLLVPKKNAFHWARCGFVLGCLVLAQDCFLQAGEPETSDKPNIVLVVADDLGYGDLGCYGATKQRTPALDQMAKEGLRLTDFYVTSPVCTPSRSSFMTGCYPRRVNMHVDEKNRCVLFPAARKGLHPDEVTLAELLKSRGYATMCIGKWHLGDHPDFLPTRQGFDEYFGLPYSNDMHRAEAPLPLVQDSVAIEAPVKQESLTARFTEQAIRFIRSKKRTPFFLYLPHIAVHVPLSPGAAFRGESRNGAYGDWIEELDGSMGQIFAALQAEGLDTNTLVIFTSDNGSQHGGSNEPLRGGKGETTEGGMRVPCLVRWPGKIPAGATSAEVVSSIDWLPTIAKLAGAAPPRERPIDGFDIWPILSQQAGAKSPHEVFYYYQMDQLQAVRSGEWKLHLPLAAKLRNWNKPEPNAPLTLIHLAKDIHEDKNLADAHPEMVRRLLALAEKGRIELGDGERQGAGQRPAGWVDAPSPRLLEKRTRGL